MSDFNENQTNEQSDTSEVSETSTPDMSFAEAQVVGGVEPAKKKPIFLIIAIILVIIAGGFAASYAFVPWVKNNVKMLVSKPENYYLWVEEENLQSMADSVSEGYGKMLDTSATTSGEVEIKLDMDTANVGSLIEELSGTSLSESGITIPANIAIKGAAEVADGSNLNSSFQINAADKTLATLNMFMKDGIYYYQIPELSSSYISMDINTLMESSMAEMGAEASAVFDSIMEMSNPDALKEILSEKELNELIVKYFTIVFENLDDVKLEKGVGCEVNGVKAEYNVLSADVDEGALFTIAKDVLKEAKNDNTIIKIVEKFGVSKDDYTSTVQGLLDELGSLEVSGGETLFTMNVYVDSKGKICGRDVEVAGEEAVEIGYMTAENGSENAMDIKLIVDGEGLQVVGNSTEKSGKESGEFKVISTIEGANVELPISYKDVETVDEAKGYCKGEMSIDLSPVKLPVITLVLDSDGKGQTIKSDIAVGGKNYGTLSIISREETSMEIPAFDSAQKVYPFTENGEELNAYGEEITQNLAPFLDNIGSAVGIDGLGTIFASAMTADPTITQPVEDEFVINEETNIDNSIEEESFAGTTYDFSKIAIQINGQSVTLPAKINGIFDYVNTTAEPQIEAGMFTTYYSDDYTFGLSVSNESEATAAAADCTVTGISVANGSAVSVTFDGFTVGSNINDFAAKYGVTINDPSSGCIDIYDTASDWNSFSVYYYDGVIDSIYMDILDY